MSEDTTGNAGSETSSPQPIRVIFDWRTIETAPKDGTYVLVTNRSAGTSWIAYYLPVFTSGYRPKNPWSSLMLNHRHFHSKRASIEPTHWMPLPDPPDTTEAS